MPTFAEALVGAVVNNYGLPTESSLGSVLDEGSGIEDEEMGTPMVREGG